MATFGNTGDGSNVQTQSADRKYAYKASPSTSGIITGGTARVWLSASGSSNAKLVIYSDNAGEPDALLAVSDQVAITNTSEQAINFTFSGVNRLSITASTQYWVGIHFSDPGTPNFTISRANTSSLVRSSLDTYSDGPSSTFSSTTTSNGPLDIYITYSEPTLSEGSTTTLEDFETIGDWTLGGDTGYDVVEDTTYKKSGSKSFKFTAPASGGAYVTRTINTDFLFVNTFSFWVYIPTETDLANFYSVSIYLTAQSDFSTYFIANPAEVYHLGWNKIILHKDDFTASGAATWAEPMIRLRVRANADPTGAANVYVDKLEYNVRTAPKVVITFDDGWDSQYSIAYPYMDTLGLRGTAYIIAEKIDTSGYMTTANLHTLYGDGWDLCTHGLTNLTTLSLSAAETDVLANRQFLLDEGLVGANNHYAYPEGGYNADIMDMLTDNGFISARTIVDRVQASEIGEPQALTRRGIYDITTLATAQGYIDKLIKTGGILLLNFHKIVTTPSVDTEWATADFEDLMDYIKTKSDASALSVITVSEMFTNNAPTVTLNSPADSSSGSDTTPTLDFTGTDTESNDIRYNVQISDTNYTNPAIRSSSKGEDTTGTAMSVSAPSGTTAGDFVVVVAHGNGQTTITDNNGSTPFTATAISDWKPNTGSGHTMSVYYRQIQSGDPSTYNFTLGASGRWSLVAVTFTGGHAFDVAPNTTDRINDDSASTGTITVPSLTTTFDKVMHITLCGWDTGATGTISIPSGYTELQTANGGSEPLSVAYKLLTTEGATGGTQFVNTEFGARLALSFSVRRALNVNAVSGTDAGFSGTPDNTDPFASGQAVTYTVQSALTDGTYYWRVRGIDPSGSNTFGAWATTRSFTVSTATAYTITKSLKYCTKVTPTAVTKSLKYAVKTTPTTLTKALVYRVKYSQTAMTKTVKYTVIKAVTVTKSLKYAVVSPNAAVQKSLKYCVVTPQTAVTKALVYKIVKATTIQKGVVYKVLSAQTITKQLAYTVITSTTVQKSLVYKVVAPVAITKQLKYTILEPSAPIQKSARYAVVTTSLVQKQTIYTVLTSTTIQKSLTYDVLSSSTVTVNKDLTYKVLRSSTLTKNLVYAIKGSVTLQKSLSYHIVTPNTPVQKSLVYRVVVTTAITKSLNYSVLRTTTIEKQLIYVTLPRTQAHTVTKRLKYTVAGQKPKIIYVDGKPAFHISGVHYTLV